MADIKGTMTTSTEGTNIMEGDQNQAKDILKAVKEDRNYMPYQSASSCIPIGAVIPAKLSYETVEALNKFRGNGIDTAEFVRVKLGYNSRIMVCQAFSSEQVDAIALAITQIENGKGFILGDMAGIGKGRVVAGILRYAYHIKKNPIFMTIGSHLFSDIYRDFWDIGGFSGIAPAESDNELPNPFIFNDDGIVQKTIGEQTITLFEPFDTKKTVEFCKKNEMPKDFDIILLTYSQLSQDVDNPKNTNAIAKYEMLKALAPNSIFVLDESHKGAGDGNIAINLSELIALSSGVMFASATYAKVPKSMMLYIPKTDIADSKIRPQTITDAVAENGEAIQEYIASLLVKSGQMIRRGRDLSTLKVDYRYMPLSDKPKDFAMYDDIMALYNVIDSFANSKLYKKAVSNALERYCLEHKVELVKKWDTKPTKEDHKAKWYERNKNNYTFTFNTTNILKNRFQWIENLLFAIKTEFVADTVIDVMRKREDEKGNPIMIDCQEGNRKYQMHTNYKPVVAVRNTAEAGLKTLGYKIGDIISKQDNDYAKTLINIIESLNGGKLTFKPVNTARKEIVITRAIIKDEDYSDNGVLYAEKVAQMKMATSGLPLSPLDAMVQKIENAYRESWDDKYTKEKKFIVEEVTKRSMAIIPLKLVDADGNKTIPDPDGRFEIVSIKKESATDKTARFNAGKSDVIILNTAGSTGISLHSKLDYIDKRPRVMVIHQVELDVATEVQKWGRINRTGQVNNPSYMYVVSTIPSEIRKLMMLRRKLRSLDANTTGNVRQSEKASQILDIEGNEIEDMANKYGYIALIEFLEEAGNEGYKAILDENNDWYEKGGSKDKKFENYLRELEKLPCGDLNEKDETKKIANQESFYDRMNAYYVKLKKRFIEADDWDLETSMEDINASTRNKKVLFRGNNENQFTKSVFIEDKWVTPKGKPYSKEELSDAKDLIAGSKDHRGNHNNLIYDFGIYVDERLIGIAKSFGEADTSNAESDDEKQEIIANHRQLIADAVSKATLKFAKIKNTLIWFYPNRPVQVPFDIDILEDGAWESDSKRKGIQYGVGVVVGIKSLSKSDNKFSPMNLEIEIASLSKIRPHLKMTLTSQYQNIIDWIMGGSISQKEDAMSKAWEIQKSDERDRMRVLTGELFKAFEVTGDMFSSNANYKRKKRLIKYSTIAGTVETGIKLWMNKYIEVSEGFTPVYGAINSERFIEQLMAIEQLKWIWLPSKNEGFLRDENGAVSFNLCTGIYTVGKEKELKKPNKLYLSDYLTTSISEEIENILGKKGKLIYRTVNMESAGSPKYFYKMKFLTFDIDLRSAETLKSLLNYFNAEFKVLMEIKSKDGDNDYIIYKNRDMYEFKDEQKSEEGIYDYYPLLPFGENTPPDYIDDSFREVPENEYGMISLRFALSVIQCSLFNLVPANITEKKAVVNILHTIGDEAVKIDFISKVKDLGDDYIAIESLTQETIGVSPSYAIGLVDSYYAGQVIAENIDKASKPSDEEGEDKGDDKQVKTSSKEERAKVKIPLNWDTAQDFIIKLKSL